MIQSYSKITCPDNPGGQHRWNGDGQCLDCCNYATDLVESAVSKAIEEEEWEKKLPTNSPIFPDQEAGDPSGGRTTGCDKCDGCGSAKTYANQACMPLNGRVQCIDWCIHHIVAALNAGGVETVASCCGHQQQDGRIDLADGRILIIRDGDEQAMTRVGVMDTNAK